MAKVGRLKWTIDGESIWFELHYSQKEHFHLKGFPDKVCKLTDVMTFGYLTEPELRDTIFWAIQKYHQLKKNERKVIGYSIRATSKLTMNYTGDNSYQGQKKGISKRIQGMPFGMYGAGLEIQWRLLKEVDDNGKKYFELKDDGISVGHELRDIRTFSVIEWTEEREAFFKNIDNGMQELVYNISKFFTDDDEQVTRMIDAGGLKLLLNS